MDYSYSSGGGDAAGDIFALIFSGCYSLFMLAFGILILAAMWKIFTKAGKPGWAAIVPIYNIIVLMEIIGRPTWWVILYLVPMVNAVVGIINSIDLAKAFGKDLGYGLGLSFLSPIFYPMLGFGKSVYVGPVAAAPAAPAYYPPQPPYAPPVPPAPPAYAPPAPPAPPAYVPPAPPVPPAYAPPAPPAPAAPPAPPVPPAPPAE